MNQYGMSRIIIFCSGLGIIASRLIGLYPKLSYEELGIYLGVVGVLIAAAVSMIIFKNKQELVLAGLLVAGGLILAQYTSYQGVLLSCMKTSPFVGYCAWIIWRLFKCEKNVGQELVKSLLNPNQDINQEKEQEIVHQNKYANSFANAFFLTLIITVISLFYFPIFNDAIPKEERGIGLLWGIKIMIFFVGFGFVYVFLIYITKKVYNWMIWTSVIVCISIGIIPGYFGLGWIYAIVMSVPWGMSAYFAGKMEQERLKN